ncbi:MAG TPA: hypothetical protein VN226_10550 [Anaerolineales bacterium]|nr:hypothetical protein [Anaerolineales bacterium]
MKRIFRSSLIFFLITILLIGLLSLFGPEEKSLGSNIRIVYLHGAWVLTAEATFVISAIVGALFLVSWLAKREKKVLGYSSRAAGITGVFYWVTYLPLSMYAMQANWNGLFLAEPRFALALTFAIVGVLLQIGLWLMENLALTSFANVVFIIALRVIFSTAENVMHPPPSPIFNSGNAFIITYFVSLMALTFISAFFLYWAVFNARAKENF